MGRPGRSRNREVAVKRIAGFLTSALLGGFFVILPIALIIFLLQEAFGTLMALMAPIVDVIPIEEIAGAEFATVFGILVLLVVCFLAGAAVRTGLGKRVSRWFDDRILGRIPGYSVIKSMTQQISGQDDAGTFTPAVATLGKDIEALAFIIEEHDNGFVTVLLPSVPMAMTGMLRYMRGDMVRKIDASFTDVVDTITYWGTGSAKMFKP